MEKIDARRKRYGTGVVLGKFMPPHRGHLHLIDQARSQVAHLTVLVATLAREPIPGVLRHRWMQALYPDLPVCHLTDENPSEPHEHPDFWAIWTRSIRRFLPAGPDAVFTSETYGDRLAACLGAEHVLVDLARATASISASAIRDDPYRHWDFLPACVRAYYARRVVLIGAESTGKTSLAARLAAHYDTVWLPEYGREYIDRKQAPPEPDDIPRIAREQLRREDLLAQQANRLLLCDTDLIVTSVLSDYYFGACPAWIRQASYERSYDLHVLCDTDVPWEADPFQREGPAVRARLQGRYVEELEARGLPTVLVSGTVEARMRTATAAIDRLFAGSAYRAGLSVSRTDPK